ncbi:uncharacterized protein N7482_007776 [Penicillium canariense]|uniref:NACHT domain-containing protein n=1 Tax=Penicillium canariense TaxID=189055 RepID=A0A9W9LJH3_9EURO|nr:uncharacterized protein N7482_007776 [Penicillium canariense]KAJ5160772.1 hypothetical protein N7482_007776 [Penicillium canariense]
MDFLRLWQLLLSATRDPYCGDLICLFDGLDECRQSDRDQLIQELERLYTTFGARQRTKSKIKIFVTSRPYGDIEWGFGRLTSRYPTIRLAADDEWKTISEEIIVVMEAKVDEIAEKRRLSNEIRRALKRRFTEISNRTYLWLHLTLDALKHSLGLTQKKLLRRIDELPESVEQAYEAILERCNRRNWQDTTRLLNIIVASQWPLSLSEIDVALEVGPNSRSLGNLDLEGPSKRKQWIRDACGLFVSIIDSHVYLIHQTAREFLLRHTNERAVLGRWRHSINLQDAHLTLSKVCIAYLILAGFQMENRQVLEEYCPAKAFLRYSAQNWIYHTQEANITEENWIRKAAELCAAGDRFSLFWVGCNAYDTFWEPGIHRRSTSLIWATRWGLIPVIQHLLEQTTAEVEITEAVIKTAAGNTQSGDAVMKLLLDRGGTEIKITNAVVKAAAENTQRGDVVMNLLLDRRGEDINITQEVVAATATNWNKGEAVMRILLERKGADIKITEFVLTTVVRNWRRGGEAVIKLLLDQREVDVEISKAVIATAAGDWGEGEAMMKLLLDRGKVDVEVTKAVIATAAAN